MRLLMINLLAAALVLFSATFASAFELRLIPTTPTTVDPGGLVSYDLFLDSQGENGIVLFSVGLTFDPSVLTYRPDLSDAEDYYPLYAPAVGKTIPATFLIPPPGFDPPQMWPVPPPGLQQVNVDFIEANLNESQATATNQFMATLTFEATGLGTTAMDFSFDNGGNIFNVGGADVSPSVSLVNGGPSVTVIPEPTTALLVGLGLVGLGVAGRRRA
jgi:hypothetical protein